MQPDEIHRLNLTFASGRVPATLLCWDEAPEDRSQVMLRVQAEGLDIETCTQDNYFRCLIELRRHLERLDARIECLGSCLDVYPSGMIESMGYAEQAFKLRMGQPTTMQDLVRIFDVQADMRIATIEQQAAYYDEWFRSIIGR